MDAILYTVHGRDNLGAETPALQVVLEGLSRQVRGKPAQNDFAEGSVFSNVSDRSWQSPSFWWLA
jgi:hypothetical protein